MRVFVFFVVLIGATSCASVQNKQTNYRKYIVGTWAEVVDRDGGILFYDTYFPDGRFHGYGYTEDGDDDNEYVFGDGFWEIDEGKSCITINFMSDKSMPPGERFCHKIIKLNEEVFIFYSGLEDVTMYRVSDGSID